MNIKKGILEGILACPIWFDLLANDCLHVELIQNKHCKQLLLYADQTLLRSWSSDTPYLVRCFFEEKEFVKLKAGDSECLSFFCQFPDTMTDHDFDRIRQQEWKKQRDEGDRRFNERKRKFEEEMRGHAELLSKPWRVSSMKKWGDKTSRNTTWWDKKARGRG